MCKQVLHSRPVSFREAYNVSGRHRAFEFFQIFHFLPMSPNVVFRSTHHRAPLQYANYKHFFFL